MSDPLPPIPSPPAHFWRQLRLQYLPVIVFVIGVVAAIILWSQWVAPPALVGEAEATRADVRSMRAGILENVKVSLLQPVRAGDPIAEVSSGDPAVAEATLAIVRAELDSIRVTMNPVLGQQRTVLDYERLLLDLMSARVTLASLQAQLFQAEGNFARTNTLFANKLVTEERYEEAKNTRDALSAQVKAQLELIARVEPGLKSFSSDGAGGELASPAQGLRAALKLQEEKIRLAEASLRPLVLTSPIDGIVTQVYRQSGETVVAGEPLFQVSATRATRIVGFMRQPVTTALKPGMTVEVRTRSSGRHGALATVTQIGEHFEPISPTILAAMRLPVSVPSTELGLRVLVTPPKALELRPGEHVDMVLRD